MRNENYENNEWELRSKNVSVKHFRIEIEKFISLRWLLYIKVN